MVNTRISGTALAAVAALALAGCGGSSDNAASKSANTQSSSVNNSATPSATKTAAPSTSTAHSTEATATKTPTSTSNRAAAPVKCSAQALDEALARHKIVSLDGGRPAQVGDQPECRDGWFVGNVYEAGEAMVVMQWRDGEWKLVTSNTLTMCEKQLRDA